MRAALAGLAFMLMCSLALAGQVERSLNRSNVSAPILERDQRFTLPDPEVPRLRVGLDDTPSWQRTDTRDLSAVSAPVRIGPLTVRSGKGVDGRQHFANYTLDDVNIMGSEVSGTVDGSGAKVFLRWHPGE